MNMKTVRRGAAADEYVTGEGLKAVELAPGVTPDEVRVKTGCHVHLSHLAA